MKALREEWFAEIKNKKDLDAKMLLKFHHEGGNGDKDTNLIIDRGFLKTKSITQITHDQDALNFWYEDLETGKIYENKLLL